MHLSKNCLSDFIMQSLIFKIFAFSWIITVLTRIMSKYLYIISTYFILINSFLSISVWNVRLGRVLQPHRCRTCALRARRRGDAARVRAVRGLHPVARRGLSISCRCLRRTEWHRSRVSRSDRGRTDSKRVGFERRIHSAVARWTARCYFTQGVRVTCAWQTNCATTGTRPIIVRREFEPI